jgi:hypothetical protein
MENISINNINNHNAASQSRWLLTKFSKTWERRAQVRTFSIPDDLEYEVEKPDFIEDLIPIKDCKAYQTLTRAEKNTLLSYGWLAYNGKTIAIESKIIAPLCYDIIDGHLPGTEDNNTRKSVAETLTDESYHILLCHQAMTMTERLRHINRNIFPAYDLEIKVMALEKSHPEEWQKMLIRFAVAIVSEIFISDYLKCLSSSKEIVTLNRETVRAHRMDEIAHGRIFTELAKLIYQELNPKQKKFFSSILHLPVQFFASKELNVWNSILHHVCPMAAPDIMAEILTTKWFDTSTLDYANLIALTDEIGINDFPERLKTNLLETF